MINNRAGYLYLSLLMLPVAGFGIDIYTPALPLMSKVFSGSVANIKMTITLYILGLCIGQIYFGALSDSKGRKLTLGVSSFGFAITSFCVQFMPNLTLVLLLRLCQGIFVGGIAVNCRSIVSDIFSAHEISKISPYMSMAWSLSPIIAPLIGAYLQISWGWAGGFYFLFIYGVIVFVASLFMKETNVNLKKVNLAELAQVYKKMYQEKVFLGSLIVMGMTYSIILIFSILSSFLIQNIFHKSTLVYGRLALLTGLAYFLGSMLSRLLLQKFKSNTIIQYCIFIMLLLSISYFVLSATISVNLFIMYLPIFFLVLFGGVLFPNCLGKSISCFPEHAGKASSIAGTGFMLITVLTSSLTNYIFAYSQIAMAAIFMLATFINFLTWAKFLYKPNTGDF